ncbi:MAG: hypothetical protein COA43_03080 [Robiginitomaculum sp.]|nr:MAG: hypothetical protein COA43_03080 [Robiginitomaculum sp.]
MRVFSLLPLVFLLVFLVSCATVPPTKSSKPQIEHDGLAAQELSVGECGIFLWTLSTPPVFSFFQKQESSEAKLFLEDSQTILTTLANTQNLKDLANIDISYLTPAGKTVKLKAQFGEELTGGRRIHSGALHVQDTHGWQKIIPVSGVYVCR